MNHSHEYRITHEPRVKTKEYGGQRTLTFCRQLGRQSPDRRWSWKAPRPCPSDLNDIPSPFSRCGSRHHQVPTHVKTMAKQTARTVGSQIGRQILRGIFGGLSGKR
ncbi:MAG: helicase HerA-like domain-containing protein [Luteimonas sp.]